MIKKPSSPHSVLNAGNPKSYRIFVVDDDELVRTNSARRLRQEGFDVHEFESGESVVEYLDPAEVVPDVIILDFKMTGLNGIETTRLIRQRSPSVPIILFTAYPGAINVDEAKREGIVEILTKEIELESLREVIHHALQRQ